MHTYLFSCPALAPRDDLRATISASFRAVFSSLKHAVYTVNSRRRTAVLLVQTSSV